MKYFTIKELTRSDTARWLGIDNTSPPSAVRALHELVDHVLDPLREAWGGPIRVNSGYRCPELNQAVGGTPGSQHQRGEAADITVGSRSGNRRRSRLHKFPSVHLFFHSLSPHSQLASLRFSVWS